MKLLLRILSTLPLLIFANDILEARSHPVINFKGHGGTTASFISPRIVGGNPASKFLYPYAQVSLQFDDKHYCGGSVVAPDMILSAAHCDSGIGDTVVVGAYNVSDLTEEGAERFRIGQLWIHPLYRDATNQFDINLIQLQSGDVITVTDPIRLNEDGRVPFWQDTLTAIGWGATALIYTTNEDYEVTYPDILQEVNLTYVTNTRCNHIHNIFDNQIASDMMCAWDAGQTICFGDSGGPLLKVTDNPLSLLESTRRTVIQVGVTSWLVDCSGNYPPVFQRTSSSFVWLREKICEMSISPPDYLSCNARPSTFSPTEIPTSLTSSTTTNLPTTTTTTPVIAGRTEVLPVLQQQEQTRESVSSSSSSTWTPQNKRGLFDSRLGAVILLAIMTPFFL